MSAIFPSMPPNGEPLDVKLPCWAATRCVCVGWVSGLGVGGWVGFWNTWPSRFTRGEGGTVCLGTSRRRGQEGGPGVGWLAGDHCIEWAPRLGRTYIQAALRDTLVFVGSQGRGVCYSLGRCAVDWLAACSHRWAGSWPLSVLVDLRYRCCFFW